MKQMLIITGPQGSGNHVFSKIFALHDDVYGWKDLLNKYWIAHDHEPFNDYWDDPNLLANINWSDYDYWVTSISCPYANKGVVSTPNYKAFIDKLKEMHVDVQLAIIGRDQTVLKYQQQRVRDTHSYPIFEEQLNDLMSYNPIFLSTELLYLYKDKYLKYISKSLDFPIAYDDERLSQILQQDANEKYFKSIEPTELDKEVRRVSGLKEKE